MEISSSKIPELLLDPSIIEPENSDSENEQPAGYSVPSSSQGTKRRIVFEGVEVHNASLPEKWTMIANEKVRVVSMTPEELFLCYDDLEMDRSTMLYYYESTQLQYFLPWLPLLKVISLGDQSFIKWCYSSFPNLKLITQNFPRVLSYPSKLICNSSYFKAYRNAEGTSIPS